MGKNIYNRKKGYRYEQKKKKIKREVLSYEDMPLEDYEDEGVELSKPALKKILICIAGIIALGLVVFAIANRDNLTPDKITRWITYDLFGADDSGYPVEIMGSSIKEKNIFSSDEDLSYVSDTTYQTLNSEGNEVGYYQISYSKPVLKIDGENVLIYNLGGYGYVTGKKDNLNNEKENKFEIYSGDINKQGDYCLVTNTDGYFSKVTAYNKKNERLYSYSFSQYYAYSVAINDKGTGCVVIGTSAKEGSMDTVIYALDFSKETPVSSHSLGENLIYEIDYLETDKVIVIGSDSSYSLNIRKDELNQFDYSQMKLTTYDINTDTSKVAISLSRSGDGRQCTIFYLNSNGETDNTIKTNNAISSLSLYKSRVAFLDENTCYLYNTNGKFIGSKDAGNGAKVVKYDSNESVYILGINEVRKILRFDK